MKITDHQEILWLPRHLQSKWHKRNHEFEVKIRRMFGQSVPGANDRAAGFIVIDEGVECFDDCETVKLRFNSPCECFCLCNRFEVKTLELLADFDILWRAGEVISELMRISDSKLIEEKGLLTKWSSNSFKARTEDKLRPLPFEISRDLWNDPAKDLSDVRLPWLRRLIKLRNAEIRNAAVPDTGISEKTNFSSFPVWEELVEAIKSSKFIAEKCNAYKRTRNKEFCLEEIWLSLSEKIISNSLPWYRKTKKETWESVLSGAMRTCIAVYESGQREKGNKRRITTNSPLGKFRDLQAELHLCGHWNGQFGVTSNILMFEKTCKESTFGLGNVAGKIKSLKGELVNYGAEKAHVAYQAAGDIAGHQKIEVVSYMLCGIADYCDYQLRKHVETPWTQLDKVNTWIVERIDQGKPNSFPLDMIPAFYQNVAMEIVNESNNSKQPVSLGNHDPSADGYAVATGSRPGSGSGITRPQAEASFRKLLKALFGSENFIKILITIIQGGMYSPEARNWIKNSRETIETEIEKSSQLSEDSARFLKAVFYFEKTTEEDRENFTREIIDSFAGKVELED